MGSAPAGPDPGEWRRKTNVELDGLGRTNRNNLSLLQCTQQLPLRGEQQILDFAKKRVPRSVLRMSPGLSSAAPVKAPFLCPNSSGSTNPSGKALQLTETKGADRPESS
jgi:hypothetical protein